MPKIEVLDKITQEPYNSILNMFLAFYEEGLKPIHLRYELGKESKDKKGNLLRAGLKIKKKDGDFYSNVFTIKKYLEKKHDFYINDIIKNNDYIKYPKQLSEKLEFLLKNNIIFYDNEKKVYRLNKNYYRLFFQRQNIVAIDSYNFEQIHRIDIEYKPLFKGVIYGFPKKLQEKLTEAEKEEFQKNLRKIEKSYSNILSLKDRKVASIWNKKLLNFNKMTNNNKIKQIIENDINLDLNGILFRLLFDIVNINSKVKPDKKLFIKTVNELINNRKKCRLFDPEEFAKYNFSKDDISEISDALWSYLDFMFKEAFPIYVTISLFHNVKIHM